MKKNITIDIPEGYSDVKYNSETGRIEFIKKDDKPHSWEEFCTNYRITEGEAYIYNNSTVVSAEEYAGDIRGDYSDRNLCVSETEAEAFLALIQLRQLRKAWIKDWKPNWFSFTTSKYCIGYLRENLQFSQVLLNSKSYLFPLKKWQKNSY